MDLEYIVQKNKADKGLRFVNYIIDFFISLLFMSIISTIIVFIAFIFDLNIYLLFENEFLINLITYSLYYFLIENYSKGRSIGKFITGTKVVTLEGEIPKSSVFLKRSLYRLIPFEAFSFLGANGWHDSIPKTAVVIKKHFDYEVEMQKNVAAIGTIDE